jgi:probable F420-dependent oxidoreductase
MRVGVSFPFAEIGTDRGAIRAFLEAADELGYDYLTNIDHVLGIDEASHPGYDPIPGMPPHYALSTPIHEMFTLFSYAAAVTERIQLLSSILLLAQRETALVAKQAAEVDILSGGRLVLGVGVGHTDIEFAALGADFKTRGARIEEQIQVLRLLWTQDVVTFDGRFHSLPGVGINPPPVQRPIPIWMGGWSEPALRRAARIADGICYPMRPIEELRQMVRDAGRDPADFGFLGGVGISRDEGLDDVGREVREQVAAGITHVTVSAEGHGYTVAEHITELTRFRDVLGAAVG